MAYTKFQGVQARDLVSAVISIPTSITAAGVITWTAGSELAIAGAGSGTWKALEFSADPTQALFMPGDAGVANYQIEYDDFNFTIREVLLSHATSVLQAAMFAADYIRGDFVYGPRGFTTNRQRIVVVGNRGSYRQTLQQGENLGELTCRPLGSTIWMGPAASSPPI